MVQTALPGLEASLLCLDVALMLSDSHYLWVRLQDSLLSSWLEVGQWNHQSGAGKFVLGQPVLDQKSKVQLVMCDTASRAMWKIQMKGRIS
jgi:hypothetical protein